MPKLRRVCSVRQSALALASARTINKLRRHVLKVLIKNKKKWVIIQITGIQVGARSSPLLTAKFYPIKPYLSNRNFNILKN